MDAICHECLVEHGVNPIAFILATQTADFTAVKLKDGFQRIETASYSIEIPQGWEVEKEMPWGAREISGPTGGFSAMTGKGAAKRGWEQLYQTSLYFIMRNPGESGSKATPYKIVKTKQGYEAMSFSVLSKEGFAKSRYMILRAKNDDILALSVKVPSQQNEKDLVKAFDRLVVTAKLK
jgi:hypothetical protein